MANISRRIYQTQETVHEQSLFKGIPYQSTKNDVIRVFSVYGSVEYVYFMCEPKRKRNAFKMGYVVFGSRDAVDLLLSPGNSVMFDSYSISCQEYYNTKKSRRNGGPSTQTSQNEFKLMEEQIAQERSDSIIKSSLGNSYFSSFSLMNHVPKTRRNWIPHSPCFVRNFKSFRHKNLRNMNGLLILSLP